MYSKLRDCLFYQPEVCPKSDSACRLSTPQVAFTLHMRLSHADLSLDFALLCALSSRNGVFLTFNNGRFRGRKDA